MWNRGDADTLKVVPDPSSLHIELRVNGELRQTSPTADLLFDVTFISSQITKLIDRSRISYPFCLKVPHCDEVLSS